MILSTIIQYAMEPKFDSFTKMFFLNYNDTVLYKNNIDLLGSIPDAINVAAVIKESFLIFFYYYKISWSI